MPNSATKSVTKLEALYAARVALMKLVLFVNREEVQFLSTDALSIMENAGIALEKINQALRQKWKQLSSPLTDYG